MLCVELVQVCPENKLVVLTMKGDNMHGFFFVGLFLTLSVKTSLFMSAYCMLLTVNNIKPRLLGLLGGLCVTTGPLKVAKFSLGFQFSPALT